jgi:hypothetical protein
MEGRVEIRIRTGIRRRRGRRRRGRRRRGRRRRGRRRRGRMPLNLPNHSVRHLMDRLIVSGAIPIHLETFPSPPPRVRYSKYLR